MRAEVKTVQAGTTGQAGQAILWNTALLPFTYLLPLVSSIIVARALGPSEYGVFAILSGMIGTLYTYLDLGVARAIPRFVPEVQATRGHKDVGPFVLSVLLLRSCVGFVAVGVMIIFANPIGKLFGIADGGLSYITMASTLVLISLFYTTFDSVLLSFLKTREVNVVTLLYGIMRPVLIAISVLVRKDVFSLLVAWLVSDLFKAAMFFRLAISITGLPRRMFPLSAAPDLFKRFLCYSASFYAFRTARYFLDLPFSALLLASFGLADQVGYLSVAFLLASRFIALSNIPLQGIQGPILTRSTLDITGLSLKKTYSLLTKLNLLVTLPPGIFLVLTSHALVKLLYSVDFVTSARLAPILIGGLVVSNLGMVSTSVLQVYEKYREQIFGLTVAVAVMFLSSSILVPRYQGFGSALAISVSTMVLAVLNTVLCHWRLDVVYPFRFLGKVLAGCGMMTATMLSYERVHPLESWTSVAVALFLSGTVFVTVWKLLGGFEAEERDYMAHAKVPFGDIVMKFL